MLAVVVVDCVAAIGWVVCWDVKWVSVSWDFGWVVVDWDVGWVDCVVAIVDIAIVNCLHSNCW